MGPGLLSNYHPQYSTCTLSIWPTAGTVALPHLKFSTRPLVLRPLSRRGNLDSSSVQFTLRGCLASCYSHRTHTQLLPLRTCAQLTPENIVSMHIFSFIGGRNFPLVE